MFPPNTVDPPGNASITSNRSAAPGHTRSDFNAAVDPKLTSPVILCLGDRINAQNTYGIPMTAGTISIGKRLQGISV